MAKENSYRSIGGGMILGTNAGMHRVYKPKVKLCGDILRLSSHVIAEAFGVVGKPYIEGVRSAMLEELTHSSMPFSSWREVADRVKGRHSSEYV